MFHYAFSGVIERGSWMARTVLYSLQSGSSSLRSPRLKTCLISNHFFLIILGGITAEVED
jgi:hypothetical protein